MKTDSIISLLTFTVLFVYILPLRNENLVSLLTFSVICMSLYPTFKEWKQDSFSIFNFPSS